MKKIILSCLCCSVLFILSIIISSSSASEIDKLTGWKFAQLAKGGVLYDNWPAELRVKVDKTHPAYPAGGKIKGADTWRCKECHGWDYKGRAGVYSSGGHYTGIGGIRAYANQDPVEIVKVLKNKTHAFENMIGESDLEALALFVSFGQIDMDLYIDRTTKKVIGEPANGARIYLTTCIKCHGEDGKAINSGTAQKPVFIGTSANKNPWENLHKIRWGHPGTQMISLLFLGLKDQLDVLSFCKTLPEE